MCSDPDAHLALPKHIIKRARLKLETVGES
jgi:hypothetical protein